MFDTGPSRATAMRRSLFPASIVPKSDSKPKRPRAVDSGAFEQQSRWHIGRQSSHFGQLSEDVEVGNACETVGPDRNLSSGLIEFGDGRSTRASAFVAARTRHQRRALRCHPFELRTCPTARRERRAGARRGSPSDRGSRPGCTSGPPTRNPTCPIASSNSRQDPMPLCRNSISAARLTKVHTGSRKRGLRQGVVNGAKERRRNRVWRVWGERVPHGGTARQALAAAQPPH